MNETLFKSALSHFLKFDGWLAIGVCWLYLIRCLIFTYYTFNKKEIHYEAGEGNNWKKIRSWDLFIRIWLPIILLTALLVCTWCHGQNKAFRASLVLSLVMCIVGLALLLWTKNIAPKICEKASRTPLVSEETGDYYEKIDLTQFFLGCSYLIVMIVLEFNPVVHFTNNQVEWLWMRALTDGTSIGGVLTVSLVGTLQSYTLLSKETNGRTRK
jgi:hypothetical protein